jgi:hypothetical protein
MLSLLVQLNVVGGVFGMAALSLFAVDELVLQFAKSPRSSRMPGKPLF